jgi:hypothetical protein
MSAARVGGKGSWQRRVSDAFTQRLLLKGTAISVAIILWLIATAKEPTQDLVPVRFVPTLDSTLALRDEPPSIQALVAGRGEDLLKLYSTPLVLTRAIASDVPDTLVIDLRPGDVVVPAGLEGNIIVRDVQPRSVMLRFETTSTRLVPVRSRVRLDPPSPGWRVRFEPESVEVSGPRQMVAQLTSVSTVNATIPAGDSVPHLVDVDTARLGVRVRPVQVKVHVLTPPAAPAASLSPVAGPLSSARQAAQRP